MDHDVIVALCVLAVAGQALIAVMLVAAVLALIGVRGPLDALRRAIWGYELWGGFVVAAIATGGSLFFSEIRGFIPCDLCWFQRICMYPLSWLLLVLAWRGEHRTARYLLPLPVVGACVSIYHLLIEHGVITEPKSCNIVPSGAVSCGTPWISEFGYITIPLLALTGFLLLIGFLSLPVPAKAGRRLRFPPMPSGKRARQQRQQATNAPKAPPPVRSKGGGAGGLRPRQASPRALAIGGGVVVIVIVAIVLAVVLGKSNSPSNSSADGPAVHIVAGTPAVGSATGPTALPGAPDVATLFKGVPQNHFILGSPNAPVLLTEFIDLQCPYCQQFETEDLPTLVQKFVRTDKLRIKIEPWSILDRTSTEYDSDRGQKATIAAAAQNKAFDFSEVLYDNQPPNSEGSGWMNDALISQVAASVDGLDTRQLGADVNSSATKTLVQAVDSLANRLSAANQNFNGTPGLFLSKGNGPLQLFGTGPPDLASLESAINALAK